jgi:hypothetical protein
MDGGGALADAALSKRITQHLSPEERRKIQSDEFISLRKLRPVSQVSYLDGSEEFLVFKGSTLTKTREFNRPKISSQDDLLECVEGLVAVESILCPRKMLANASAFSKVKTWCSAFPWKSVLEYVEAVRMERQGQFKGFTEVCVGLYQQYLLVPRWAAMDSQAAVPQPKRRKHNEDTSRRPRDEAAAGIKRTCLQKSLCIAFNGEKGCAHQGTHSFKTRGKPGREVALTHQCAKCDSTAHGAASCSR